MKKFTFLFLIALFSFNAMSQQYNFTQNGLFYKITDATNHKVSVVSELAGDPKYNVKPTDTVSIPEVVTNNGVDYTVTAIGSRAFFYCPGITWVRMPKTITSIGSMAFTTSRGIEAFEIAEGGSHYVSEDGVLYNISKTVLVAFPPKKTGVWTCPATVTSIGEEGLNGAKISGIMFPDSSSLTSIGKGAFTFCENLVSIALPAALSKISDEAFYRCTALEVVDIPNNSVMSSIGRKAFVLCGSLHTISLPTSLTDIGNEAFSNCKSLKTVDIPSSVNTIGVNAFNNCDSLTAVNVDTANLKYSSDEGVLYNKAKTTLMLYPMSKPSTSYTVADSTKVIESWAMYKIPSLTSLSLPSGLTNIGTGGLSVLPNLSSLTCSADSPAFITLGEYIFYGIPKNTCTLFVPAGSESAYRAADKWKEFMQILPIGTQVGLDVTERVNINIYPNPAVDFVIISPLNEFDGEKVSVFDLKGNEIYSTFVDSPELKINVQGWTRGVYVVRVGNTFGKLIVK